MKPQAIFSLFGKVRNHFTPSEPSHKISRGFLQMFTYASLSHICSGFEYLVGFCRCTSASPKTGLLCLRISSRKALAFHWLGTAGKKTLSLNNITNLRSDYISNFHLKRSVVDELSLFNNLEMISSDQS